VSAYRPSPPPVADPPPCTPGVVLTEDDPSIPPSAPVQISAAIVRPWPGTDRPPWRSVSWVSRQRPTGSGVRVGPSATTPCANRRAVPASCALPASEPLQLLVLPCFSRACFSVYVTPLRRRDTSSVVENTGQWAPMSPCMVYDNNRQLSTAFLAQFWAGTVLTDRLLGSIILDRWQLTTEESEAMQDAFRTPGI